MSSHSFYTKKANLKYFEKSKIKNNKIPHELYTSIKIDDYFISICEKGRWKTSGFTVICLLLNYLNIIDSLTLFGLDFNFNSYDNNYSKSNKLGQCHSMGAERDLFKKMYLKFKDSNKIHIHDKDFLKYILE